MRVTTTQLRDALKLVRRATAELVRLGEFHHGVLTRLNQWKLPPDRGDLAKKIASKARKAGKNGVKLDGSGRPSLESLVVHYAELEPELFPPAAVRAIREKLGGSARYSGLWP